MDRPAVRPADVAAVVALVNECRDRGDDPAGWRRHLAAGLRDIGPDLAAAALAAVEPLVGGPLARDGEPSAADLPGRLRDVLRCLLDGDTDKQIAARLGVSRFTVNQYTKRLYRHFGVRGRAELMARWVRRAWAAGRPGW